MRVGNRYGQDQSHVHHVVETLFDVATLLLADPLARAALVWRYLASPAASASGTSTFGRARGHADRKRSRRWHQIRFSLVVSSGSPRTSTRRVPAGNGTFIWCRKTGRAGLAVAGTLVTTRTVLAPSVRVNARMPASLSLPVRSVAQVTFRSPRRRAAIDLRSDESWAIHFEGVGVARKPDPAMFSRCAVDPPGRCCLAGCRTSARGSPGHCRRKIPARCRSKMHGMPSWVNISATALCRRRTASLAST